MIPAQNIVAWGVAVPWADQQQVEQALIISRALIDIFNDKMLGAELRFRGGTALNKLHFPQPLRYSEDIDLVRTSAGPIGPILDQLRVVLEPWLGRAQFDQSPVTNPIASLALALPSVSAPMVEKRPETPKLIYAEPGQARIYALRAAWPIACRRLEEFPNINAMQLFEELCAQFPGRFTRKQYKTLARKVSLWRLAAHARGVVIGSKTYRRFSDRPRGRRPETFKADWNEMEGYLEEHPDKTALELLVEFQARYPGQYSSSHLRTLQKRVRAWRQQAIQRLIGDAGTLARIGQGSAVTV